MNLKKLVIHNLASLQDATIAFDEAPLQGESIFLITGPTGAGKSMLLDAICLALYNEVPRLHGVAETGVNYTERFNAARGKEPVAKEEQTRNISLNDPRQLMRRGTAECYVRLSFELDDGEYQAEWSLRRAHGRRDGNMGSVKWTLTDPTGQVVDKNVKETIVQRVGLTFDQFCRTVMLAQGEFTKFIQSRTEEKSAILQKITGTEIYETVGRRIGERYNSIRNEVEKLQAQLETVVLFTSEEREQRQRELTAMEESARALQQQERETKEQLEWQERAATLQKQYLEACEALQAAETTLQSESYRQEQRDIEDYDRSAEARSRHIALQRSEEKRVALLPMEGSLRDSFLALEAARLGEEGRAVALQQRSKELEATLQTFVPHRAMLDEAQGLLEQLKQLQAMEQELSKQQRERDLLQAEEPQFAAALATAREAADKAVAIEKEQEKAEEEKRRELALLQPAETAQQAKMLTARKDTLLKYRELLRDIQTMQEQQAKERATLQEEVAKENASVALVPTLQRQEQQAKAAYDRANTAYDAVRDFMKNDFQVARQKLRRGDTCPLCGSTIEMEMITDEEIARLLRPKEEAMKRCQEAWIEAQSTLQAHEAKQKTVRETIATLQESLSQQENHCRQQQERLPNGWSHFWPDETMPPTETVAPFLARAEQEQHTLEERQKQLEARQEQIHTLQLRQEESAKHKEQLRAQREQKEKELERCRYNKKLHEERLQQLADRIAKEQMRHGEQMDAVAQKITYPDWQPLWREEPAQLMQRLSSDAAQCKRLQEESQTVATALATVQKELCNLLPLREKLHAQRETWFAVSVAPAIVPTDNLLQQWQQLWEGYSLWAQQMATLRTELQDLRAAQQDFFAGSHIDAARLARLVAYPEAQMQQLREAHKQQQDRLAERKGRCKALQEQQQQHARLQPTATMAAMDELRSQIETLGVQLAALQQQIGSRRQALHADEEQRMRQDERQKEKEKLDAEKARWDLLYRHLGDTDGKKFRNVAQSFILRHLLDKANRYLRHFTDRYELTCETGNLVILVQDRLTNLPPQYVKVLSGGESFMVSLSLALALAQLNPHTSSVNILFIDEGFGTLDEESLHAVMETLSRLHAMGGRKVGVISHVEELETLIPTKIRVQRTGTTHSTVTVVTE